MTARTEGDELHCRFCAAPLATTEELVRAERDDRICTDCWVGGKDLPFELTTKG